MGRSYSLDRITNETDLKVKIELDGTGQYDINTGIGFFDHMLTHIAKHGFFDFNIKAIGDLEVDDHHTIEDTGIVLGQCLKAALQDKKGIKRYGQAVLPMDDVLMLCAIDLSGRPYLNFDVPFTVATIGNMATEMIEEFFRAICTQVGMNLHFKLLSGQNNHHIAEAVFKSFAKALDEASSIDPRIKDVLSTKGSLD